MDGVNEYKTKAENAVTTGNAVLQDAEQTLRTLQGIMLFLKNAIL